MGGPPKSSSCVRMSHGQAVGGNLRKVPIEWTNNVNAMSYNPQYVAVEGNQMHK